ncbi:DUF6193 family natural product biosynthesis protein [Actinoplanes sp. NPDC051475]|uniref:DUF6193 family natural product biosynthesis protein n=1 Tax=Actinoplanes sp. NPDC051475 TaxID=3157225 RepID=UPI00344C8E42
MADLDLASVLNAELGADSPYRFVADQPGQDDSTAKLTHENRVVAAYSSKAGGYRCTFWWKGRKQAHGMTAEIPSVADAARLWVEGVGLSRLSAAHPFVQYHDIELAYERGEAVEYQWRAVLRDVEGDDFHGYRELVTLASEEPVLRRCFPRLNHRFVLSENEDNEDVLITIFLIRPEWFAKFGPGGGEDDLELPVREFEGTAREAVAMMAQAIRARGAS